MRGLCFWLALVGLALGGCSGDEHDDGHGHHGGGGAVEVPEHYGAAVAKCEELSVKIESLIAKGNLHDVHGVAADIKKIAEKLPALAQEDLPPAKLRDVNVAAKKLAGMSSEIDAAADAGRKDDTIALHKEMKGLIAGLEEHAGEAADHEGH